MLHRLSLAALVLLGLGLSAPAMAQEANLRVPVQLEWGEGLSDEGELSLEERRKIQERLRIRRKMVDAHQVLSFVSAGSIIATEVVGIVNDVSLDKGIDDSGIPLRPNLEPGLVTHRILAGVSIGTYLGAGITAWAMPRALKLNTAKPTRGKLDSGVLHVVLSVIHGVSMATVVATGILQANVAPVSDGAWDALVVTHKISGFTAAGFILAAGITIGTL